MMHTNNRDDLLARCRAKVARRPRRLATAEQLRQGIPIFLEQLCLTLAAEESSHPESGFQISGNSGGDSAQSEMGMSAEAHGRELMVLGFTVDQVVHDYGDLCQAITDLAVECDAPFAISEFRTLNRCLDNAIADAVMAFNDEREESQAAKRIAETDQRIGSLVHELRNFINNASLAVKALEIGNLPLGGATGAVLKRSLKAMSMLTGRTINEVRHSAGEPIHRQPIAVSTLLAQARDDASLSAIDSQCDLALEEMELNIRIRINHYLILAALANLLQNAFKFSVPHGRVTLRAYARSGRAYIEIADHCGGLAPGAEARMFSPFVTQKAGNKSGLGLGLTIARENVQADGGTLDVRNIPGIGCVFTMSFPLYFAQ